MSSVAPRFRVGNQSAFSASDLFAPFCFALTHALDAFEWFSDRKDDHGISWDTLDAGRRDWIRRLALERGLKLTVHAPWQASPLDAPGRAALEESVSFAADVGASLVVFHLDLRDGPGAMAAGLEGPVARARRAKVRLAAENTVHTGPDACNAAFRAFRDRGFSEDVLGMCLDIGHANLCTTTRHDYVGFVDSLDEHIPIIHAHFHENWGDRDEHLPLFTGPAEKDSRGIRAVLERLAARDFDGVLTLEVWPTPPELLLMARSRLEALITEVVSTRRSLDRRR